MSADLLSMQRTFLRQMVSPEADASTPAGMQAYRDAYLLRINEALCTDFDAVHQILGDEEMLALTTDYVKQHPSQNPSIRWIGQALPSFISSSAHWSRYPLLADVAHFERAKSNLFDAKDAPIASLADLQSIEPELWGNMTFELIPALSIETLPSNVPAICQQLREREQLSSATPETTVPWMLWRKQLVVHWRSLDTVESHALQQVLAGATFAGLCEQMIEHVEEENIPSVAMQLLLQWCNDQIIRQFNP